MTVHTARHAFVDRHGHAHPFTPGFARTLFDGPRVVGPISSGYPSANEPAANPMAGVRNRVALGVHAIDLLAPGALTRDTLVIGADDGAECLWLIAFGHERVVGINLTPPASIPDRLRNGYEGVGHPHAPDYDEIQARVRLAQDNIERSGLPDRSFDRIYSWQTLEHITDPAAAFREIARLLRPGGVAFIEYNPFYSIDGAHWLATTDLPWAHARLDDADFARALDELMPDHRPEAAAFVRDRINRMPIADLQDHAAAAGLTILALLPRTRTEDLLVLNAGTLDAVRRLHPRAETVDLISRIVRVVLRRDA
jgi:SAM-dependent methyltransferase